jgi:hypothetical protein
MESRMPSADDQPKRKARNAIKVTPITLLTDLHRSVTDPSNPTAALGIKLLMRATVMTDRFFGDTNREPTDTDDVLEVTQHVPAGEIIEAGERIRFDMDLFGNQVPASVEDPQALMTKIDGVSPDRFQTHETSWQVMRLHIFTGVKLKITADRRMYAVCDAGDVEIDRITLSSPTAAIKIRGRSMVAAGVTIVLPMLQPDQLADVAQLVSQIIECRTTARAKVQQPHMRSTTSALSAVDQAFGLIGSKNREGRLVRAFKNGENYTDITTHSSDGLSTKVIVSLTDRCIRQMTGHPIARRSGHSTASVVIRHQPGEGSPQDLMTLALQQIDGFDLQAVKQYHYIMGECALNPNGWGRFSDDEIARGIGLSKGGKQYESIQSRLRYMDLVELQASIKGLSTNVRGDDLSRLVTTPLLMRGDTTAQGTEYQLPTTLHRHINAGWRVQQDRRALLLGTKSIADALALRLYWSGTGWLTLQRKRGVKLWSPKIENIVGAYAGWTADSMNDLKRRKGDAGVLDMFRDACRLLESFTAPDGQTVNLVQEARITGDTIAEAHLHLSLLPTADAPLLTAAPV